MGHTTAIPQPTAQQLPKLSQSPTSSSTTTTTLSATAAALAALATSSSTSMDSLQKQKFVCSNLAETEIAVPAAVTYNTPSSSSISISPPPPPPPIPASTSMATTNTTSNTIPSATIVVSDQLTNSQLSRHSVSVRCKVQHLNSDIRRLDLHECAGCYKTITERYLLKALDLYWHEDCLKCGCCDCRLGEVGSTLYTKANLILCKRDYLR